MPHDHDRNDLANEKQNKTVKINKDQNIQHIRIVNLINLHSPKKSFPISGVCRQVRRSVRAGLRAGLQVWALQSRGRPGLGRWGLGPRRKKCGNFWFLPPEMVAKPTTKWDTMRINQNQWESMRYDWRYNWRLYGKWWYLMGIVGIKWRSWNTIYPSMIIKLQTKNESVVDGRDVNHGEINRKDGYCEIG